MDDSEEWGPWIDHDGRSRPVGHFVEVEYADGVVLRFVATTDTTPVLTKPHDPNRYPGPRYNNSWVWTAPGCHIPVRRYRIRKPRALKMLREIAATVRPVVTPEHERLPEHEQLPEQT